MMNQDISLPSYRTSGPRAALFLSRIPFLHDRHWLLPALLFLLLLAPLARWGIPATRAGLLLLDPALAGAVRPLPLPWLGGELGYKLSVGASVLVGMLAVGWTTRRLWGTGAGWWGAALWMTVPLHPTLLYQHGWPLLSVGVALLALAGALLVARRGAIRWLALPAVAVAALLLHDRTPALSPQQLFAPLWAPPEMRSLWLARPTPALGLLPLLLTVVALTRSPRSRPLRLLLAIAVGGALLALAGVATLTGLTLATLALVLAAAAYGVPSRTAPDTARSSLPVALIVLAALGTFPALQPFWVEAPPAVTVGAYFGAPVLLLVEVERVGEGEVEALWQVVKAPERDYTVFVHLLDETGEQVGQADALLVDEAGTPSLGWPVGTLVRQRYPLTGPAPAAVRLGLYDLETLERLPRLDGGDSVLLPMEQLTDAP